MKIRTDFVTNSSSSSFTLIKVKSEELVKYVNEIREQVEIYNLQSTKAVLKKIDNINGEENVNYVKSFYYSTKDNLGYSTAEMNDVYGPWSDFHGHTKHLNAEITESDVKEVINILLKDAYSCDNEIREKLKELIKSAEYVEIQWASFTSD